MKKAWGDTQPVLRRDDLHIDLIQVKAGGFSSWHKHRYKSNEFVVIKGELWIELDRDDGRHLLPGCEAYDVPAGVRHQFHAPEAIVAIEVYRLADPQSPLPLDEDDIFRDDLGGINPAKVY